MESIELTNLDRSNDTNTENQPLMFTSSNDTSADESFQTIRVEKPGILFRSTSWLHQVVLIVLIVSLAFISYYIIEMPSGLEKIIIEVCSKPS